MAKTGHFDSAYKYFKSALYFFLVHQPPSILRGLVVHTYTRQSEYQIQPTRWVRIPWDQETAQKVRT